MTCPQCQHENRAGAKFCEECATPLARTCSNCGSPLSATAKFCPECAHAVDGAALQPRFVAPESYTPKHLAEKILTSKAALEGERKQVTVLFADLKGSMELLADRDPEEARKLLDPVLEHMMEAVHHYEGTVNQVMGDGIMALFGAPIAHEDHAVRACYAALRMQETVKRDAEDARRAHGVNVRIRVGLNSGEVVVRAIGSDLHMDYTAVGQTTHLAARMEQLATPGSVFATADTSRLTEGYVEVKTLGPVPVKGLADPIDVYEVVGVGPLRFRLQASVDRGLARFVGRGAEIEALRGGLAKARTGRGQVVALVGEPGVGKSRLLWEFLHSHATRGCRVLESRAVSYGKAMPYLPLIDLLKAHFKVNELNRQQEVRERISGEILTLGEVLRPRLTALLSLLEIQVEDSQWQMLDPFQRRQQTLDGLKHLFLLESEVQPLVLVFEDLHWVDPETEAVVQALIESLPTTRILLLISYRPEYHHSWSRKTYYTQLPLDPLPDEIAAELLQVLLGDEAGLQPLKRLLIDQTDGNPFFLEESVRTLVETRVLAGERGAYHLLKPVRSIQVPTTVQTVVASRIDRLPPEDKRLLQAASVLGKDVPFALLRAIADLPDDEIGRGLTRLQAAELLYEVPFSPYPQSSFKHALTQEVAYASLLRERRRNLHGNLVQAMESLFSEQASEYSERLALHALHGEQWEKAATYSRQAGSKAMRRAAYREAIAHFEQALTALEHLPNVPSWQEQRIDLHFRIRHSLVALGDSREMLSHLVDAEKLAETLGDQGRLGRVATYMTHYFWYVGEHQRAVEAGQRALAIAADLDDVPLRFETGLYLGSAYYSAGKYPESIDILRRHVELLKLTSTGDRAAVRLSAVCHTFLAWSLSLSGDFGEAVRRGEDGILAATTIDDPFALIFACFGLGGVHVLRGAFSAAVPPLERGWSVCEGRHVPALSDVAATFLGSAYSRLGRSADALPLLKRAAAEAVSLGAAAPYSGLAPFLGGGYLALGEVNLAAQIAQRGFELARERDERGFQAENQLLLGDIALHASVRDAEHAAGHYGDAMALAEGLGMRPAVARCHLGIGRSCRQTGKREEAHEHLITAMMMFRDMDMRFWLEQAEVEMRAQ